MVCPFGSVEPHVWFVAHKTNRTAYSFPNIVRYGLPQIANLDHDWDEPRRDQWLSFGTSPLASTMSAVRAVWKETS